ncbi:MAG: hypothetical protein H7Y32_17400 [Chloroflexales bacterium]|nr:hypothetical protein [Chloroflexales bacterium]
MTTTEPLLQQAIAAAKAGNRAVARDLLLQVVSGDERNEQGWLWLSGVVDDPAEQRIALENVLDINPRNASALKGIAWLDAHRPQPAPVIAPPPIPAAPVAPPQPVRALPAVVNSWLPTESNPCPYCGAHTSPNQQRCTFCKHSLMIAGERPDKRTVWTTLLAVVWFVFGGISLLGTALLAVFALGVQSELPPALDALGSILWTIVAVLVLLTALYGFIAFGLWGRQRWAYIAQAALLVFSIVAQVLVGLLRFGAQDLSAGQDAATSFVNSPARLFCQVLFWLVLLALTALSYRDFFGQRVRVLTDVPERKADEHFNMGVTYRNRGMWYMAAREWESAVKQRSNDADYHRALGLAYAQLKDYGRALREVQAAIDMRPGDALLREDLAVVEKMALQ